MLAPVKRKGEEKEQMSHLLVIAESKFGYMLGTLEYLRGNPTSVVSNDCQTISREGLRVLLKVL